MLPKQGIYLRFTEDDSPAGLEKLIDDKLTDSELAAARVTPNMIRLWGGIEHIDDILADLDQAPAAAG